MSRQIKRTGEGQLGCILAGAAFVIVALVAWQALPVKVRSTELYDYMKDQAQNAGNREASTIKKRILRRADELELPVTDQNLTVTKGSDRVRIKADYVVPLEFPGYTYEWEFNYDIDVPIFYY